jgi:hypothetical protein
MRPEERNVPGKSQPQRRRRFELFFYEQEQGGTRYYLRFTRLALVLVVCLTAIPAVAIFALFLTQSHADLENVNINIRTAPQAPGNYPQLIKAPPPPAMPSLPKAGRSPRGGEPARQTSVTPGLNTNTSPTPIPTPSPPRPPG